MADKSSEFSRVPRPFNGTADVDGDADFAAKFRAGEPGVMEAVFYTYFDRLYSLIFHSVGDNQAVAEDIAQETFLSAMKSAKNFQSKSKLYTWLVGIAHHKIIDYYRHMKVERKYVNAPTDDDSGEIAQVTDGGKSVIEIVESAESDTELQNAMQDLPVDYRQVLLLKYIEEMSVSEICQVMNRSPKAIEGLLTRAKKALREKMDRSYPESK